MFCCKDVQRQLSPKTFILYFEKERVLYPLASFNFEFKISMLMLIQQ